MKSKDILHKFYFKMGADAFHNGISAPFLDPDYMDGYNTVWKGAKPGDAKSKEAMGASKSWLAGWMAANFETIKD